MDKLILYEILVPTIRTSGKPIKTRFHRVWDAKVRAISNGLTILMPAKGQWINEEGTLYQERMIPVRIACTEPQIHTIADLTAKFYEQDAIMYYKLTEDVFIVNYDKHDRFRRKS